MYETFEELGIVPQILKAVEDMGFEEPTPIQKQAIPLLMAGQDIAGQAQTGVLTPSARSAEFDGLIWPRGAGLIWPHLAGEPSGW